MSKLNSGFSALGELDELSYGVSPVHNLDSRIKLLTTFVFIIIVTSFDKYEARQLVPLVLFPVVMVTSGNIPLKSILRRVLIVSPFAVLIGIFNPLFDRVPLYFINGLPISGGWISFLVILIKFVLTVSSSLILVSTTGFYDVCLALSRLRVPVVFVLQLMFLYRYLFILVEEGIRLTRAHSVRSFRKRGMDLKVFGSLVGQLLLRTLDRAQRIYTAMISRGFDGTVKLTRESRIHGRDVLFIITWCGYFTVIRLFDIPGMLEILFSRIFS